MAIVLAWTRSHGLLASVHGIERPTLGATLFPVGLVLAAVIGWDVPTSYVLVALVLALADPAAAIAIGLVARALGAPLSIGAVLATAAAVAVVEGSLGFGLDNLVLTPLAAVAWRSALGG